MATEGVVTEDMEGAGMGALTREANMVGALRVVTLVHKVVVAVVAITTNFDLFRFYKSNDLNQTVIKCLQNISGVWIYKAQVIKSRLKLFGHIFCNSPEMTIRSSERSICMW